MQKSEYFEFAKAFFGQCIEIAEKKNADYTGKTPDPFANFSSVEVLGVSTEAGFLTRMMDKIKRVSSFVENGSLQVKDESVKDTLQDLANYCCLFAGYLHSKKEQTEEVKAVNLPAPGFARCTKTLVNKFDKVRFTAGKDYEIINYAGRETTLLNDDGYTHELDEWHHYFIFNTDKHESK